MSKLSIVERNELKHHVLDSIIRRLTTKETQEYIRSKMNGLDISFSHLLHVRASLRKEAMSQLQAYQRDRVSFLEEIFTTPVNELKLLKRTLHRIIENEDEDTDQRIKAINQLQAVNDQMLGYYQRLPDIINAVVRVGNNNNSSTTSIANSGPGSVKYLQWCEKNNPKHPDSCDCQWEEYQV
jgi:uncharacterized protein (UPF0305 family)